MAEGGAPVVRFLFKAAALHLQQRRVWFGDVNVVYERQWLVSAACPPPLHELVPSLALLDGGLELGLGLAAGLPKGHPLLPRPPAPASHRKQHGKQLMCILVATCRGSA